MDIFMNIFLHCHQYFLDNKSNVFSGPGCPAHGESWHSLSASTHSLSPIAKQIAEFTSTMSGNIGGISSISLTPWSGRRDKASAAALEDPLMYTILYLNIAN